MADSPVLVPAPRQVLVGLLVLLDEDPVVLGRLCEHPVAAAGQGAATGVPQRAPD